MNDKLREAADFCESIASMVTGIVRFKANQRAEILRELAASKPEPQDDLPAILKKQAS